MLGLRVATVDALGSERNIVPFVSYLELKVDTSFYSSNSIVQVRLNTFIYIKPNSKLLVAPYPTQNISLNR